LADRLKERWREKPTINILRNVQQLTSVSKICKYAQIFVYFARKSEMRLAMPENMQYRGMQFL